MKPRLKTWNVWNHSTIEDDLIRKIDLIRAFVHSHVKIDNKRIEAHNMKTIRPPHAKEQRSLHEEPY